MKMPRPPKGSCQVDAAARAAQVPRESRAAVTQIVDVWREVARDLAVAARGGRRELHQHELLDELGAAGVASSMRHRSLPSCSASTTLGRALDSYANPELVARRAAARVAASTQAGGVTDEGDDERLEATVQGIVQGVGFRWFVVRNASELGLTGWTSNEADGSVRVVAEGARHALDELERLLRDGPPGADVSRSQSTRGPRDR